MADPSMQNPVQSDTAGKLRPLRIPTADAARVLSAVGPMRVDEAMIQRDIEAGAPTNGDGTINLIHYAAWLVKQISGGESDDEA